MDLIERLIPFTPEIYQGLMGRYNAAWWPGQIAALALALAMLAMLGRGGRGAGAVAALLVAAAWLWTGWAFLLERLGTLSWAAPYYAAAFVAEGALIALWGAVLGRARPGGRAAPGYVTATLLLAAAVLLHPLLSVLTGAPLAQAHVVAMAPMPGVLLLLALLAAEPGRPPWLLLPVPVLWSLWEGAQAVAMGIWIDAVPPLLAVTATLALLGRPRR